MKNKQIRAIAFYLPQFHPIPENDEWWGKGFTEWTNASKAKPLFRGHYQPHFPADLGYYDLRLPEVRIAQAEMAKAYGIEGFCYWHYWFGNGQRLLERPFNEVLKSGEPDFPFCLGWANQTWTGVWHGCPDRILIEQKYPGVTDYEAHFYNLLEAFHDERYIKIDGKPIFVVYDMKSLPNPKVFADCWQKLAVRSGLKGIYLMGHTRPPWTAAEHGFDALLINALSVALIKAEQFPQTSFDKVFRLLTGRDNREIVHRRFRKPLVYSYKDVIKYADIPLQEDQYSFVFPNWDNTPRSGHRGIVLKDAVPSLFRTHLRQAIARVSHRVFDKRVIFVKSWNEWAEGNHLEPDMKFGRAYLEVMKEAVFCESDVAIDEKHELIESEEETCQK